MAFTQQSHYACTVASPSHRRRPSRSRPKHSLTSIPTHVAGPRAGRRWAFAMKAATDPRILTPLCSPVNPPRETLTWSGPLHRVDNAIYFREDVSLS